MTAFLKSPEDLQWLRDVHPAVRPWTFYCAILVGHQDCPDQIILAERDHFQSIAVTLVRDENAPDGYRASIGKLG